MEKKPQGIGADSLLEDIGDRLHGIKERALGAAENVVRRSTRVALSLRRAQNILNTTFQFTCSRGSVYARKSMAFPWVAVGEPGVELRRGSRLHVQLPIDRSGGGTNFDDVLIGHVKTLFTDSAYAEYRQDQETLNLFGDPSLLRFVVENPDAAANRSLKRAVEVRRKELARIKEEDEKAADGVMNFLRGIGKK